MLKWKKIFGGQVCNIFGMIHLKPLPGSPNYKGSINEIVEEACKEAEIYQKYGLQGVILENMNDIPYVQSSELGPEITAAMTRVCTEVRNLLPSEVLAGCNKEALSVALASGLQFIRAEGFVFSHVADEGLMNACAGSLLRFRSQIGADDVLIFTDVKKKHCSHSITADLSLSETVRAAEFFLSDGVVLTGSSTGQPTDVSELQTARRTAAGPVLVGSGVTLANLEQYLIADGLIVGSYFKHQGRWQNNIDEERLKKFMETFLRERAKHIESKAASQ